MRDAVHICHLTNISCKEHSAYMSLDKYQLWGMPCIHVTWQHQQWGMLCIYVTWQTSADRCASWQCISTVNVMCHSTCCTYIFPSAWPMTDHPSTTYNQLHRCNSGNSQSQGPSLRQLHKSSICFLVIDAEKLYSSLGLANTNAMENVYCDNNMSW